MSLPDQLRYIALCISTQCFDMLHDQFNIVKLVFRYATEMSTSLYTNCTSGQRDKN